MGIWNRIFGGGDNVSHQLPGGMVAPEFGEVNVKKGPQQTEVTFTILMEPTGEEGWQTGVALDASGSMKNSYIRDRSGASQIEPVARDMTAYLAGNLDADGGTTVIYWACGPNGSEIEEVGDLTSEQCKTARFDGPARNGFGGGTVLKPAVEYFAQRFRDAPNGIYLFITDGQLDDLEEVKKYTISLCRDIEAGRRNPLKFVLIGLGSSINEKQMEQLDDLDSGTSVDLWDHKIAREMRGLVEIFAEVVSENQVVAPQARILDSQGRVVRDFPGGLPAKVSFTMSAGSDFFELDLGEAKVRQSVVVQR